MSPTPRAIRADLPAAPEGVVRRWFACTRAWAWVWAVLGVMAMPSASSMAGDFSLVMERPTLDRWVYPFNFQPGVRVVAPTYGSFDSRFDTRDAQFLLGWDTMDGIATNAGPSRYLVKSLAIEVTSVAPIAPNKAFVYDPTHDPYYTYVTNLVESVPDADPGRPIELFGAAYRGGFDSASFKEDSAFGPLGPISGGNVSIMTRNVYAAMHDIHGTLIDIANHVGQRNPIWTDPPFEVRPWAIGTTTNAVPGAEMPDGATMRFQVDLTDPLVRGYIQEALHVGRLRLIVSSLSPAGQSTPGGTGAGGAGAYPWWATKENLLYRAPRFELNGTLVGDADEDADDLPDDWERFWFEGLSATADGDPDGDGASNRSEWMAGTDPRQPVRVLRVEQVEVAEDGVYVVRFSTEASRRYVVEASADLAGWTALPGTITYPRVGGAEWRGAGPTGDVRFLRLRAEAL